MRYRAAQPQLLLIIHPLPARSTTWSCRCVPGSGQRGFVLGIQPSCGRTGILNFFQSITSLLNKYTRGRMEYSLVWQPDHWGDLGLIENPEARGSGELRAVDLQAVPHGKAPVLTPLSSWLGIRPCPTAPFTLFLAAPHLQL